MSTTEQAQEDWVARLSATGPTRDDAIAELHAILVRGLGHSLSMRSASGLQVEDIAQESMLKILDSLDTFAGRSRFTTWAMTIATRVGISELRRKHYQDVSLDSLTSGDGLSFEVAVDRSSPAQDELDRTKILGTLKELIASELSSKQSEAVEALLKGMPVEEIASRTGSNRNAVYKLIHDARARLKAGFERAGLMAEDISAILA